MGSTRILVLSTLVALVSGAAVPALGVSATFTGTLTTFTGTGTGVSADTVPGSGTASYGIAAFTLPSGAFVTNHTSPIGWTSSAAQGTAYTIRQIVNQSSAAGNFASSGPSFGGVMSIGRSVTQQFGVVPFPVVFASIVLPVEAGAPGTATTILNIGGNVATFSVVGNGWTTGAIVASDQTASAPTATVATTLTAVGSNNLTAHGGQITLVTPYLIRTRGTISENRAGYAMLNLSFVPEPGTLLLVGLGAAALLARGRRRSP